MDTIVDAMMVIQAKKDPKHGSQQLQALGYGVSACAAIVGGLTAAFVLQSYTPYVCFGIYFQGCREKILVEKTNVITCF